MQKRTLFISRLAIILALTLVIQSGGFPQPITGPLINAMLLITASILGRIAGVLLGTLTPIVALIRGQLPPVLAPMVPFIVIGNGIFVFIFMLLIRNFTIKIRRTPYWTKSLLALIPAALAKFLFLFLAVRIILPVIFDIHFPDKIVVVMSTPQFFTALIGGIIAIFVLVSLQNKIL